MPPRSQRASTQFPPAGEWLGGLIAFPGLITGEGPAFRPDLVLWVEGSTGRVMATEVVPPGEGPAALRQTAERLLAGGRPTRLRVADQRLRDALDGLGVEVAVGPTPEVAAVARELTEHLAGPRGGPAPGYLEGGAAPEVVEIFFRAAARYIRSVPWEVFPDDGRCLGVELPTAGLVGGAAAPFGEMGTSRGLSLYASLADFERFLAQADSPRPSGPGVPVRTVMFGRKADLSSRARREIAEYGWESVRGAVPELLVLDPDALGIPPREEDYRVLAACLEAVASAADDRRRNPRANTWSYRVPGLPEIRLRYPHPGLAEPAPGPVEPEAAEEAAERFGEAVRDSLRAEGETDDARLEAALRTAATFEHFRAMEGGRPWSDDLLGSFLDWSVRKWSLPPGEEQRIPDALAATFRHLERTGAIDAVVAWNLRQRLARSRERFLADAADPRNYGPAKGLVMAAARAGADLEDPAALEAFLQREGDRLLAELPLPVPATAGPRTGRNDPCPCGSGKKFKKCCGR